MKTLINNTRIPHTSYRTESISGWRKFIFVATILCSATGTDMQIQWSHMEKGRSVRDTGGGRHRKNKLIKKQRGGNNPTRKRHPVIICWWFQKTPPIKGRSPTPLTRYKVYGRWWNTEDLSTSSILSNRTILLWKTQGKNAEIFSKSSARCLGVTKL